jgi:hypothetical protein
VKFFNYAVAIAVCLFVISTNAMFVDPFPAELTRKICLEYDLYPTNLDEHSFDRYIRSCPPKHTVEYEVPDFLFNTIENEIRHAIPVALAYVNRYSYKILGDEVEKHKNLRNIYEILCSIPREVISVVRGIPTKDIAKREGDTLYFRANIPLLRAIQGGYIRAFLQESSQYCRCYNLGCACFADSNFSFFDSVSGKLTTILHEAIKNCNRPEMIVPILLYHGVDPERRDGSGKCSLDLFFERQPFENDQKVDYSVTYLKVVTYAESVKSPYNSNGASILQDLVRYGADVCLASHSNPNKPFSQLFDENGYNIEPVYVIPESERKEGRNLHKEYLIWVLSGREVYQAEPATCLIS